MASAPAERTAGAASPALDRVTGGLLVATTILAAVAEWTGARLWWAAAEALAVAALALLALAVGWGRRVYVLVGFALAASALLVLPDGWSALDDALASGAFIAAFFTALATLRHASASSEAIRRCGRYLARQPPGRRYLALTLGGAAFASPLSYGAIILLGTMAEADAREEPDPEIRRHRLRRMLLAIQRGFVSTLAWSPFAFSLAISVAIVPGASWGAAVGPCLVSALILAGLGWALDSLFKPRLVGPRPPPRMQEDGIVAVWPLALLLGVLILAVGGLYIVTEVRAVGIAMAVVPLLALVWVSSQARHPATVARRAARFATTELPGFRGELTLLMMAGVIGTLGGRLAEPAVAALGLDLAALPSGAILVALVWIVPLAGQLGMNPILSVSALGPLLPAPAEMGVEPADLILALTGGWALSGASSPFTATTLLVGSMAGRSAVHVGIVWNGLYTALGALLISGWVVVNAG